MGSFYFRVIKMSSPMLNNVMLAGSLLIYLHVVMATIDYAQLAVDGSGKFWFMVTIHVYDIELPKQNHEQIYSIFIFSVQEYSITFVK